MYLGNIGLIRVYSYRGCISTMHFSDRLIVQAGSKDYYAARRLINNYIIL